jgi:Transposase DDE domain
LRYGLSMFCLHSGQPIDLAKLLQPGATLDLPVLLGHRQKLPVRLLAFPLPEAIANERRR